MSFNIYTCLLFLIMVSCLKGQNAISQAEKIIQDKRFDKALQVLNNIPDLKSSKKGISLKRKLLLQSESTGQGNLRLYRIKKVG